PRVDPRRPLAVLGAAVKACRLPLAQPKPTIDCIGLQGDGTVYQISFSVGDTAKIAPSCTEMLSQVHRHLRHAGIALGIPGVAVPPPVSVPTINDLLRESDAFGELGPDERELLAVRFAACSLERGEALLQQGHEPEALFLLVSGTVELTDGGI